MDAEASPPHSKATSLPLPGSRSEISSELPEEGKCQHHTAPALRPPSPPPATTAQPPARDHCQSVPTTGTLSPAAVTRTLPPPASATRPGTGAQWGRVIPHNTARLPQLWGHKDCLDTAPARKPVPQFPPSPGPACPTMGSVLSFLSLYRVPHTELGPCCQHQPRGLHPCPGPVPVCPWSLGVTVTGGGCPQSPWLLSPHSRGQPHWGVGVPG